MRSIDDTSNFDEFPDVDLKLRKIFSLSGDEDHLRLFVRLATPGKNSDVQVHDWLFMNYTYKRFDGSTSKPKLKVSPSVLK